VPIGTQTLTSGSASITTAALASATHTITAVYGGDPNFTGSTSPALQQVVQDFNFNIVPDSGNPGGSTNQTITPGQTVSFKFSVQPVGGIFNFPITLSATGLPPGASVVFTPSTVTLGATGSSFTMAVMIANTTASARRRIPWQGGDLLFAVLLLPFIGPVRRKTRQSKLVTFCGIAMIGLAALTALSGCGTGDGFFGQKQKSYTVTVNGKATGPNGVTLQHVAAVTLTVQ